MSLAAQKIIQRASFSLELVTGLNSLGKRMWAFVLVRQDRLDDFRTRLASGAALSQLGSIIARGNGDVPPHLREQIVRELETRKQ